MHTCAQLDCEPACLSNAQTMISRQKPQLLQQMLTALQSSKSS